MGLKSNQNIKLISRNKTIIPLDEDKPIKPRIKKGMFSQMYDKTEMKTVLHAMRKIFSYNPYFPEEMIKEISDLAHNSRTGDIRYWMIPDASKMCLNANNTSGAYDTVFGLSDNEWAADSIIIKCKKGESYHDIYKEIADRYDCDIEKLEPTSYSDGIDPFYLNRSQIYRDEEDLLKITTKDKKKRKIQVPKGELSPQEWMLKIIEEQESMDGKRIIKDIKLNPHIFKNVMITDDGDTELNNIRVMREDKNYTAKGYYPGDAIYVEFHKGKEKEGEAIVESWGADEHWFIETGTTRYPDFPNGRKVYRLWWD